MKCWYMNGAGNDFVVMDARNKDLDLSALAARLCRLVGADGFMALDESEIADFKLHFYNADGSRGEMCGNGARCICRFAYENGLAEEEMTVETDAGLVRGRRLSQDQYRVKLNLPSVVDLHRKGETAYVELGDPGVPHAVLEVPDLSWDRKEALLPLARALRRDPAFPKGANVNFFTMLDKKTARILTFERGVEDYTLACGTGSASLAVVLWAQVRLCGGCLTVENPGGTLKLRLETADSGALAAIYLEGPTEYTVMDL